MDEVGKLHRILHLLEGAQFPYGLYSSLCLIHLLKLLDGVVSLQCIVKQARIARHWLPGDLGADWLHPKMLTDALVVDQFRLTFQHPGSG